MSSVVVEGTAVSDVIRVGIVDKVQLLLAFLLLIFGFVFVVDLGFDIDEGIAPVLATLATMVLNGTSAIASPQHCDGYESYMLDIVFILVIFLFLFFLVLLFFFIVIAAPGVLVLVLLIILLYRTGLGFWRILILVTLIIVRAAGSLLTPGLFLSLLVALLLVGQVGRRRVEVLLILRLVKTGGIVRRHGGMKTAQLWECHRRVVRWRNDGRRKR